MMAALALLRAVPPQVWAVAALIVGIGVYGCHENRKGRDEALSDITQSNNETRGRADDASRTVENCTGRWDRARGLCLPDDGAGR